MFIKKIMLNKEREPLYAEDIHGRIFFSPHVSARDISSADVASTLIGVYDDDKLYGIFERTANYRVVAETKIAGVQSPLYDLWKEISKLYLMAS